MKLASIAQLWPALQQIPNPGIQFFFTMLLPPRYKPDAETERSTPGTSDLILKGHESPRAVAVRGHPAFSSP
jgi:hypothetical protein